MTNDFEHELIKSAKSGSGYALAQLLQNNYSIVYKYIVKITLNTDFAADITQDVMEKCINKFHLYDPEKSSLSTWMIAIAKNLVIEEYRKNKRREKYVSMIDDENSSLNSIDEIIDKDELLTALKKINPDIRLPILLKHSSGYSYEEISKIIKVPLGTVKSRIFNGLKALRKELDKE